MTRRWLLCALLLVTGCNKPVTNTPRVTDAELSREQAMQQQMVNDKAAKRIEERGVTIGKMHERLGKVAGRVTRAGGKVCGRLAEPENNNCVFDVILFQANTKSDEKKEHLVNAWADGERIVVTPAMVRFAKGDDELAYIVSHEMAHNIMGHVSAQMSNALIGMVLGAVVDVAAASQGYNTQGGFSDIGAGAARNAYSPDFEHEADYVGLYIMALAGYDVRKAPEVWRKMSVRDPDGIYLSTTHPSNPARFIAMQKTVAEIEQKRRAREPLMPNLRAE